MERYYVVIKKNKDGKVLEYYTCWDFEDVAKILINMKPKKFTYEISKRFTDY